MAKAKLSDAEKRRIVFDYTECFYTQEEIANAYGVHRKTIYRVLQEAGALTLRYTVSAKEKALIDLLKAYDVTSPDKLDSALSFFGYKKREAHHAAAA